MFKRLSIAVLMVMVMGTTAMSNEPVAVVPKHNNFLTQCWDNCNKRFDCCIKFNNKTDDLIICKDINTECYKKCSEKYDTSRQSTVLRMQQQGG